MISLERAPFSGETRYSHGVPNPDGDYRIKSARNLDGFCPGEAAAFLLLEEEWAEDMSTERNGG